MKKLLFTILCLALVGCSQSANQASDQSSKSKPASGTPEDTSTNHVKISEIGSYYHDGELYYGYKVTNESKTQAVTYPEVSLSAKDAHGKVLIATDDTLGTILPGDTIAYANYAECKRKPAQVKFEDSVSDDDWSSVNAVENPIKTSQLSISNYHVSKDQDETSFTGDVENKSKNKIDSVYVTVLLKKNKKTVCGYSSEVENLKPGKKKSFEVSDYDLPAYDHYEIYANAND